MNRNLWLWVVFLVTQTTSSIQNNAVVGLFSGLHPYSLRKLNHDQVRISYLVIIIFIIKRNSKLLADDENRGYNNKLT